MEKRTNPTAYGCILDTTTVDISRRYPPLIQVKPGRYSRSLGEKLFADVSGKQCLNAGIAVVLREMIGAISTTNGSFEQLTQLDDCLIRPCYISPGE